jgi:hypothetical protein
MSDGHIYKRCGCRDPHSRKALGNACPKLRRPGGAWSSDHGQWYCQIELPRHPGGQRRQLRCGGYPNQRDAVAQLDHARNLLNLAGRDRTQRAEIADLLLATVRAGQPLPDLDTIRQRLHADVPLAAAPTVAAYLTDWVARIAVDENTRLGYQSHIRVHHIPHLGHLPLDKLRPRHIRDMFTAIEARNTTILQARDSHDPDVRNTVKGARPTGKATCQRIRASLRKALNDAIAEGIIVGPNPATLVRTPATGPYRSCGNPNASPGGRPPDRSPARSWSGPTTSSPSSSTTPPTTPQTCTPCSTSSPTAAPAAAKPAACSKPKCGWARRKPPSSTRSPCTAPRPCRNHPRAGPATGN